MDEKQADRFKAARIKLGLSQQQVADAIGLKTNSAISQIEKGVTKPSEQTIRAFSEKLRVNYQWLMTGEGEMLTPTEAKKEPQEETTFHRFAALLEKMHEQSALERKERKEMMNDYRETIKYLRSRVSDLEAQVKQLQSTPESKLSSAKA